MHNTKKAHSVNNQKNCEILSNDSVQFTQCDGLLELKFGIINDIHQIFSKCDLSTDEGDSKHKKILHKELQYISSVLSEPQNYITNRSNGIYAKEPMHKIKKKKENVNLLFDSMGFFS